MNNITHKFLNELTFEVVGSAIEVQKNMGEDCLKVCIINV